MIINYAEILKDDVNWYNHTDSGSRVIAWFSGGIASMVACHLSLEKYDDVDLAFCDTNLESPDTYEFLNRFEVITGQKIKRYKSDRFGEPEDVWRKYLGLGFANGAPCSTALKAEVRKKQVERLKTDYCQIFGFDFGNKEIRRATNMVKNHPELNPKFPLIEREITRSGLFKYAKKIGIKPPKAYNNFLNNNCLGADDSEKGGCVQGGIGYWQKIKILYPLKYDYMAKIEHELSAMKGRPVSINKDQRKGKNSALMFLKLSDEFPYVACIDEIIGIQPVGPMECNGFCGTQEELF